MNSITKIELPPGLSAALQEKMEAVAAAMRAPCPDLNDSAGGRDILHAVRTIGPHLASRWARFDAILGGAAFTPRVYNFRQTGKANKARWEPKRVAIASHDFLSGNPEKLRTLFEKLGAQEANGYVNVWARAVPEKGRGAFFALVHHKDGTEAAYSVTPEDGWQQIKTPPAVVEIILIDQLAVDRQMKDRWVALLSEGAMHGNEQLREELDQLFEQWGLLGMTEDQWRNLLEVIFLRQGYLDCIIEAGRHLTAPLMHEAQNLLEALAGLTLEAKDALTRRVAQLERDHSRALKRARADLDKANMSLNGAHTRNRMLAKEIALLQSQARVQPATTGSPGAAPEAANDVSLAVALDQFFG